MGVIRTVELMLFQYFATKKLMQNILLFSTILLLSCHSTPYSSEQSPEERIVFCSDRSGNYEIYTIRPDGSDLQQLTQTSAREGWPKWAPNGQQIIFTSDQSGTGQIYLMNSDGSNVRNLSNNKHNELDPVISPDGKKIAFISKATGSYQLYTMDIDGSNRKQLTNIGPFNGRPDWSPNSRRLAYLSIQDGSYEIYTIHADGSRKQKLSTFNTETGAPAWSKNGYYILFHGHEKDIDYLYRMDANGENLQKLGKQDHRGFVARWNGQSDKVVYSSANADNYDLYILDIKSGEKKRLTSAPGKNYMADWFCPEEKAKAPINLEPPLPRNHRIAFTSYRGGSPDIYWMNSDGTHFEQLTDSEERNSFPADLKDKTHIVFRQSKYDNGYQSKDFSYNYKTGAVQVYRAPQLIEGALEENMSLDSQYIAYSKQIKDYYEVYIYDKKTGLHQQITQHQKEDLPAQIRITWWSNEGSKLAYLSGKDYYNLYLRVYDLESKQTATITDRGYMFSGVVWLKDDNAFVINIKIRDKTTYELWRIGLDGNNLQQLTDHPQLGSVHPSLSPDKNWIVFESARDDGDGEIYIMRPDGSQQIRLTYSRSYEGRPTWIVTEAK